MSIPISELRKTDEFVVQTEGGQRCTVIEWTVFSAVPTVGGRRRMIAGARRLLTPGGEVVTRLEDGTLQIGNERAHLAERAALV